jgi:hypothetical protein
MWKMEKQDLEAAEVVKVDGRLAVAAGGGGPLLY